MAELADARDSKSRSVRSVGSTPTIGIIRLIYVTINKLKKLINPDIIGLYGLFTFPENTIGNDKN